jgi:hypothetical protein
MLAEALLLVVAVTGLDAFDDANLALTTCGFAAYREASERNQSLDEFTRALPARCSQEFARLRQEIIAVETQRGKSRTRASASADALIAQFQAQFARDYARRAETEAQLRALERALREEGTTNAQ